MPARTPMAPIAAGHLFLGLAVLIWSSLVAQIVPDPYLDEIFHIRQAQAYLNGLWHVWDPKITTPPGLYLASWAEEQILKVFGFSTEGSVLGLRSINVLSGGFVLLFLVRGLLCLIVNALQANLGKVSTHNKATAGDALLRPIGHAALNICLFPLMFFYSGLYYTDVLSTVSFLLTYHFHLKNQQTRLALAGLASLIFRQTNVFWSGVFLGGLDLFRVLPRGRPDIEFPRRPSLFDVVRGSWRHSCIYDPLVADAFFGDYVKAVISTLIATLMNLVDVVRRLSSYILILCGFLGFVVWNGGVVLGDKDNHIASIHLAQMLYIWPYIIFFSAPILLPYFINTLVPQVGRPGPLRTGSLRPRLPQAVLTISILLIMCAIVHFNTIVHPFTLADNRHYTFYVFRILRRHFSIKYLVVPIYFASAWICLLPFGLGDTAAPGGRETLPKSMSVHSGINNHVSFLMVWLITTTLSLSTAPLVEPRYLILPWITWRMHVAATTMLDSGRGHVSTGPERSGQESPPAGLVPRGSRQRSKPTTPFETESPDSAGRRLRDLCLWLETSWLVAINLATGYMFLYRGFSWPQERGKIQRFMW